MRKIIFLFFILILSCNSKKNTITKETQSNKPIFIGDNYFEYDEIDYYRSGSEEAIISELYDNQHKSKLDSLKKAIILDETPVSITDLSFINHLEAFSYSKSKIDSTKFQEIDDIFREKKHVELYGYACIYIYRDILVFKKKSKVIGIAKLCFDCEANIIVGTELNTSEFGMGGDYKKLRKILWGK